MDFFGAQDQARRLTRRLVLLFLAAVVIITTGVSVVIALLVRFLGPQFGLAPVHSIADLPASVWAISCAVTLAVIATGTLVRLWQLAEGGSAVARMVGARRVPRDSNDRNERRLLNVVEEMAIAAGLAVPGVYVMDEEASLNAFAAGYSANSAIVAVTRGCLTGLNRNELQGVIAHEFSHILNGDMRLNIRLMGLLHGITLIGAIGLTLLRGITVRGRHTHRERRSTGSAGAAILLAGAGLAIVGYAGVFCGRLVRAAVSRQREYLADAAAVQFTRDNRGIAGALRKIRAGLLGSRVDNRLGEEMSHLFFSSIYRRDFSTLLATHPPLDDRIRRLDPAFEPALEPPAGSVKPVVERHAGEKVTPGGSSSLAEPPPVPDALARAPGLADNAPMAMTSGALLASVGNPTAAHLQHAQGLRSQVEAQFGTLLRHPANAPLLLCALACDGPGEWRDGQRELVISAYGEHAGLLLDSALHALDGSHEALRLPLLEVILPDLLSLPKRERHSLLALTRALVRLDDQITLREFALYTLARHQLEDASGRAPGKHYRRLSAVRGEVELLLRQLAYAGQGEDARAEAAYQAALARLALPVAELPAAPGQLPVAELQRALRKLAGLALMPRMALIDACAICVLHDNQVTPAEGELLRAICATLECPVPPLLGQGP